MALPLAEVSSHSTCDCNSTGTSDGLWRVYAEGRFLLPRCGLPIFQGKEDTRLAINKEKKDALYASYVKVLEGAVGFVVTEYRGMRMKDLSAVRAVIRPVGGAYNVVKTTIFKKALALYDLAIPEDLLVGPVAVAVARTDIAKMTKALLAIKDQPLLALKGAVFGQSVFQAAQLEALSNMPTFEQARAMLLGTLKAPAGKLASLLSQPPSGLARVLKAYTDQQTGEGGAAA